MKLHSEKMNNSMGLNMFIGICADHYVYIYNTFLKFQGRQILLRRPCVP